MGRESGLNVIANWLQCLLIGLGVCIVTGAPVAWAGDSFRLGIINERPDRPSNALKQYGRLHAYLRQRLGRDDIPVGDLVIARDLNEMIRLIDADEVDALLEGVMPTLSIQRQTGKLSPMTLTLLTWRKGQRHYHSVFFVRRDSPIDSLQALRGTSIAFESPRSTSAYFVPLATLRAEGLTVSAAEADRPDPNRIRYVFAGSELNQAYWVSSGRADAGAFNNGDWDRVPESVRRELRIIYRTRSLPRWLLSFADALAPRIRATVTDVLLEMHQNQDGRAALEEAEHIVKFEILTEEDRENLADWSNLHADRN
jgi:phosphonate transport system substrate-binding protein